MRPFHVLVVLFIFVTVTVFIPELAEGNEIGNAMARRRVTHINGGFGVKGYQDEASDEFMGYDIKGARRKVSRRGGKVPGKKLDRSGGQPKEGEMDADRAAKSGGNGGSPVANSGSSGSTS